jgi:hypothetical protein
VKREDDLKPDQLVQAIEAFPEDRREARIADR